MAATATRPDVGKAFVDALAARDGDAIEALIAPEVDFKALTPRHFWGAATPAEVREIVLGSWFDENDRVEDVAVEADAFSGCSRIGYRLRGQNPDGPFVVEQQAYLHESEGRITWMRVVCSGFRRPD